MASEMLGLGEGSSRAISMVDGNRLTPFFLLHSIGGTGGWSAKGCELLSRNRTHVTCQCSHLASCAVLMDISRREVGILPLPTPSANLHTNPYGNWKSSPQPILSRPPYSLCCANQMCPLKAVFYQLLEEVYEESLKRF